MLAELHSSPDFSTREDQVCLLGYSKGAGAAALYAASQDCEPTKSFAAIALGAVACGARVDDQYHRASCGADLERNRELVGPKQK